MYIIFKKAVKYYTKESCKLFSIMALALGLIIAIILLKYKPTYKVTVKGQEIGYVDSEQNLEDRIQSEIIEMQGKNIDFVSLDNMPSYEFKLVSRSRRCNEDEIMVALKENARIMYKYYFDLSELIEPENDIEYNILDASDKSLIQKGLLIIEK